MHLKCFLCIFLLFSCSNNIIKTCDYEANLITQEEVFDYKDEYYVLIYLDKCLACRDIKLRLMHYCSISLNSIYYLDFEKTDFRNHIVKESNIGINCYKDIFINYVPHLLLISNQKIIDEWSGFDNISNQIFKV